MAIIAISRQVAALGDEIATATAQKLGYKFFDRKAIEEKIVSLGFSADKLKKYDEKKPGFFASLAKERDEYLDYLQTAILEAAEEGNCVLIGRGAFIILEGVPNLISVRCIAPESIRMQRLMAEFNWDEKKAMQRIQESDVNRQGFNKSFFNLESDDPSQYNMVINSGMMNSDAAANIIACACENLVTPILEEAGKNRIAELLQGQWIVNKLLFEHKLNINFLRAVVDSESVTLQGVAENAILCERAVLLTKDIMPDKKVESCISIVQDFRAYP